jgi:hypothetical protein
VSDDYKCKRFRANSIELFGPAEQAGCRPVQFGAHLC